MNLLDTKIAELYADVVYLKNWDAAESFAKYSELRGLIERGIYTRSLAIWLLKLSKEENQKAVA